ncbi:diguanylate cyclase domain-containing protein [Undibacterium sp. Di26W]|uniref:diguanylate cyclase domain-containing protein n=1 Tax=Undibacterium sp. Di26W TaxID=3413035 RepID=UPI003BF0B184
MTMVQAERPPIDETSLRELVETLRSRAERLESLDKLVSALKQEAEHHYQLADSLKHGLELVQQIVEEREAFFSLSLDMLCIATTSGYFHKVNRAFERTLGYTQEELLSRSFLDFVHPEDLEKTRQEVDKLRMGIDTISFDNRYQHKDGGYRWLNWTTPAPIPGSNFLYAVARDVTEQRLRDERTLYLASHDDLTGLANRWRFNEELKASFARLKRHSNRQFAVLVLDLDQFKPINDTYGHQAGDIVLRTIGERLNAIKRETDVLCRLGGDEFALLAPDANAGEASMIAERMRKEIILPISIGEVDVTVDVSIGIAMAKEHSGDTNDLLKLADDAMYQTKRSKENSVLCTQADVNTD